MKVSLIMPTINITSELDLFLSSLLNQTYDNFELVVIDQNADNRALDIITKYEEKLEIKNSFGLPDKKFFQKKNMNIEIHQFENKFTQLMGMVKKLEKNSRGKMEEDTDQYRIYDGQEMNSKAKKDYQLLNQNRITYNLEETMQNTKIYRVLSIVCSILENVKVENGTDRKKKLLFKVKDLYNGFKSEEFLNIFGLKKLYQQFHGIVNENYKYISRDMLEKDDGKNWDRNHGEERETGFTAFLDELEKL